MSREFLNFISPKRETVNTSYYRNKRGLNTLQDDILNKIINVSNYEDSRNINHLDRDFNSRYPKSYLQSKSTIIEPHGTIRTYYDKNKTKLKEIIEYRNGAKNGKYLKYYKPIVGDTKINIHEEKNFKNGVLEGKTYIYYRNGNLNIVLNLKNGKLEGKSNIYFENGALHGLTNYLNDKFHGTQKIYFENGNINSILNYYNDELKGEIHHYNNGNIKTVIKYKYEDKNKKGIVEKKFYENGNIKSEVIFENEEPVSINYYNDDSNFVRNEHVNSNLWVNMP
jgi:antitoxin component YwqK of YwqJK toxin-antitoxin module